MLSDFCSILLKKPILKVNELWFKVSMMLKAAIKSSA